MTPSGEISHRILEPVSPLQNRRSENARSFNVELPPPPNHLAEHFEMPGLSHIPDIRVIGLNGIRASGDQLLQVLLMQGKIHV
jgi:hypothetical protein